MKEDELLKAAMRLVKAMDKLADETLPQEVADVVKLHSKGAGVAGLAAGWAPGVGSTIAVTCAVGFIWTMYGRINGKIGIPLAKNIVKSIASGVCTNLAAAAVSGLVCSTLASLLAPPVAAIANAAIVYALTWVSGLVYLKVLAKLANRKVDISKMSAEEIKAAMKEVVAAEDVKSLLKEARDSFKQQKKNGELDDVNVEVDNSDDESGEES